MEVQSLIKEDDRSLDVYLCLLGDNVSLEGMNWLQQLRRSGFRADRDYQNRSIKAQMRDANRQKAKYVLILGENELEKKCFSVKDMHEGNQTEISFDKIITFLQEKISE